jgi:hypothetical protein
LGLIDEWPPGEILVGRIRINMRIRKHQRKKHHGHGLLGTGPLAAEAGDICRRLGHLPQPDRLRIALTSLSDDFLMKPRRGTRDVNLALAKLAICLGQPDFASEAPTPHEVLEAEQHLFALLVAEAFRRRGVVEFVNGYPVSLKEKCHVRVTADPATLRRVASSLLR